MSAQTPKPKPRSRNPNAAPPPPLSARAGSAGGIVLEAVGAGADADTKIARKHTQNEQEQPQQRRRRPRKLNRPPTSDTRATGSAGATPAKSSKTATITEEKEQDKTELEALKHRIHALESKVADLCSYGGRVRSPRRRGRGGTGAGAEGKKAKRGASEVMIKSAELIEEVAKRDKEEEDDDDGEEGEAKKQDLEALESQLLTLRRELASRRAGRSNMTTPRVIRSTSDKKESVDEDGEVEELPRRHGGEDRDTLNRHVTLSGHYRIPLPVGVDMQDVRAISSGVSAARDVARRVMEERRGSASLRPPSGGSGGSGGSNAAGGTSGTNSNCTDIPTFKDEDRAKVGWGEWIGGYSVAISRAVRAIEHEAGVEAGRTMTSSSSAASVMRRG